MEHQRPALHTARVGLLTAVLVLTLLCYPQTANIWRFPLVALLPLLLLLFGSTARMWRGSEWSRILAEMEAPEAATDPA